MQVATKYELVINLKTAKALSSRDRIDPLPDLAWSGLLLLGAFALLCFTH